MKSNFKNIIIILVLNVFALTTLQASFSNIIALSSLTNHSSDEDFPISVRNFQLIDKSYEVSNNNRNIDNGINFAQLLLRKVTANVSMTEQDSIRNKMSIRKNSGSNEYTVCLSLENNEQQIKIYVYNMLAKKVLTVYEGEIRPISEENCPSGLYQFSADIADNGSSLPNGVFVCVVQGRNFRISEKFIVSR